jgi:NADH-quinone oxidoreductase subunit H
LDFLPGSLWFGIKICFFVILFVWMRAALPRYRYDQLMDLGWKTFLPLTILHVLLAFIFLITFNALPI